MPSLQQLKYVTLVAETLHFRRAAERARRGGPVSLASHPQGKLFNNNNILHLSGKGFTGW